MLSGRAAWEPGWAVAFRMRQPRRLWAKLPVEPWTACGPGSRGPVCAGLTGPGQCGYVVKTRLKHNKRRPSAACEMARTLVGGA